MRLRFSRKTTWILSVAVIAIVALGGAGAWWRSSTVAANSKARCLANQRLIEAAAAEYVRASPKHTMAQIEGPVNNSNPLVTSTVSDYPEFFVTAPRCPERPNEFYVLRNGSTDCPIHGTYQ
jgi:hypothetical protein